MKGEKVSDKRPDSFPAQRRTATHTAITTPRVIKGSGLWRALQNERNEFRFRQEKSRIDIRRRSGKRNSGTAGTQPMKVAVYHGRRSVGMTDIKFDDEKSLLRGCDTDRHGRKDDNEYRKNDEYRDRLHDR